MQTITVGDSKVKLYSSIKELPIDLSKKMQSYSLQDAGIGSTIQDVDDHLARLLAFVSADKKEDTLKEIANLRLNLFSGIMELSYDTSAMACLIHSVDDVKVDDYSAVGIKERISRLSALGLTQGMVDEILSDVKKNLIQNENYTSLTSLEKM